MPLSIRPNIYLILLSLTIFLFSFIGFLYPWLNTTLFVLILVLVFIGSISKLEFGLLILVGELVLGGHGYLFSLQVGSFTLSLRVALFLLLFLLFLFELIRYKKLPRLFSLSLHKYFLFFFCIVILGTIIGFLKNDPKVVFNDANAYMALLYIPLFIEGFNKRIHIRRLLSVLSSTVVTLSLVTVAFLGIFAMFHYDTSLTSAVTLDKNTINDLQSTTIPDSGTIIGQRIGFTEGSAELRFGDTSKTKPETYRWLRDTGIAQISYISSKFFRVFFPSHVFVLFVFFIALYVYKDRKSWLLFLYFLFFLATLFISYSRSLWIGLVMGLVLLFAIYFKNSKHKFILLLLLLLFVLGFLIVLTSTDMLVVLTDRITSIVNPTTEVAGAHRIELAKAIGRHVIAHPIFGTGFGTLLAFPTILPNGEIITTSFYIFELAYGDLLVKTGLIGLFAFLTLLYGLLHFPIKKRLSKEYPFIGGVIIGVIALACSNITTPIYTHPLGIGILAISAAIFFASYEHTNSNRYME